MKAYTRTAMQCLTAKKKIVKDIINEYDKEKIK